MNEHMRKHPQVVISKEPVFTAQVLAKVRNAAKQKVREAIEIRDRQPTINCCRGWKL